MEQNRKQIEALIEDARTRRSVDAGKYLIAGFHTTVRWVAVLGQSLREAIRESHRTAINN